jgi:hypothetical protein
MQEIDAQGLTVKSLTERLDASVYAPGAGGEMTGVYAGDFLSRVMGKAPPGSVWLTVMNNVNVAGVAVLADIRAVVLCEGVVPDELLKQKCAAEGIALLATEKPVYECCKLL